MVHMYAHAHQELNAQKSYMKNFQSDFNWLKNPYANKKLWHFAIFTIATVGVKFTSQAEAKNNIRPYDLIFIVQIH